MLFVIQGTDKENASALRAQTRPAHLDYAARTGVVKIGGPFLTPSGEMTGSLAVIDVPDLAAAQDWAKNDPYAKAGLFARHEIRPWKMTVNNCGAQI